MSYRLWQCHCVADSNSVSADAGFNSVNVLEALTVSTRSWAWVCPGSSWKAMYKVVKKFTVSSNNLVHSVVVFVIVDFICLIVLKVRHKVSLSPGHTSQHAPGFHIPACIRVNTLKGNPYLISFFQIWPKSQTASHPIVAAFLGGCEEIKSAASSRSLCNLH